MNKNGHRMNKNLIMSIDGLVAALGGPAEVGDLLGIGRTGVENWSARRYIPNGWHLRLFLICCERKISVDPKLFDLQPRAFDVVDRRNLLRRVQMQRRA
jgi:hypothetical protein